MKKQEVSKNESGMEIPDYAFERIARSMLPIIQRYFESEEGQHELKEWENKVQTNDLPDK